MIGVKFITLGTLKESYLREAAAEYEKRLGAFCKIKIVELKEEKLPDSPTENEIRRALEREEQKIMAEIPPRAYRVAMCVEGKQMPSEELARVLTDAAEKNGDICFIIGSSHGLSDGVKGACDLRLSVSKLTFPHQLMRVILLEAVYRGFNIAKGTKYHK